MLGSNHSYQRALQSLGDLRTSKDEILAHWFLPYFITAAFKISSCLIIENIFTYYTIVIIVINHTPAYLGVLPHPSFNHNPHFRRFVK